MPNYIKKKVYCAICSEAGVMQCSFCKNITYCSENHRIVDWNAIHHRICDYLKEMKTAPPIFLTESERNHYKERLNEIKHHVAKVCKELSKKLLIHKDYERAIPVIMQEIRWVTEIYDAASVEIIPTYCGLIEACLGIDRLVQAENYMSHTLWCYQKGETSFRVKFVLFKLLGRICEAKHEVQESRDAIAEHLYYGAEEWGPESIQTLWGYMHMGLSYLDKPPTAYSFFAKVVKVTISYLQPIFNAYFDQKETDEFVQPDEEGSYTFSEQLDMLTVAKQHLETTSCQYVTFYEVINLFLCLGALHHFCATDKAIPYLQQTILIAEKHKNPEPILTTAKKLLNCEQLRLREWLRAKVADATIWEGLPGTWHDIDASSVPSTESHSEMMKYYHMLEKKHEQATAEMKPLSTAIASKFKPEEKPREAAGKDCLNHTPRSEELSSDEDNSSVGMPTRSLSGSASNPVSLYYLSYIN